MTSSTTRRCLLTLAEDHMAAVSHAVLTTAIHNRAPTSPTQRPNPIQTQPHRLGLTEGADYTVCAADWTSRQWALTNTTWRPSGHAVLTVVMQSAQPCLTAPTQRPNPDNTVNRSQRSRSVYSPLPNTTWRPSSHAVLTVVMKNWLPLVLGPALAMDR